MDALINWDGIYAEYRALWRVVLSQQRPAKPFEPTPAAVSRIATPTEHDLRWLTQALREDERYPQGKKWFVSEVVSHSASLGEELLGPLLDAAVDEIDPSYNRFFVEPCMQAFGPRRVNEYLLAVLKSGSDFRKAGAAQALYWAQVPLVFSGDTPSFDDENATRASRRAYEMLEDVWLQKRRLLLETFVATLSVEVRRSIIPGLNLNPAAYADSHRGLVAQAIAIARAHEDEYIRHRVEIQLGGGGPLAPLPHRGKVERREGGEVE
jgi:hypothetical protein